VSGSYDKTVRIFRTDVGRSREVYHTKRMQRLSSVLWSGDNRVSISSGYIQCCGSGMFIPDPNFFHPGSASKNWFLSPRKYNSDCSSRIRILFLSGNKRKRFSVKISPYHHSSVNIAVTPFMNPLRSQLLTRSVADP
jgi:hypothetical protein